MNKMVCATQEEYDYLKNKIMMIKIVVLNNLGLHPLTNPSAFRGRKRENFMKEIEKHMSLDIDDITNQFNDVVNDILLNGGTDVSQYPIYNTGKEQDKDKEQEISNITETISNVELILAEE